MKIWIKKWFPLFIAIASLIFALLNTLVDEAGVASGFYIAFAGWMIVFANE